MSNRRSRCIEHRQIIARRRLGDTDRTLAWLKATEKTVKIYSELGLVAIHPRLRRSGQRPTVAEHLPPDVLAYKMRDPQWSLIQPLRDEDFPLTTMASGHLNLPEKSKTLSRKEVKNHKIWPCLRP